MRKSNNSYEYIAVYVDNLAFAMNDLKKFADTLIEKFKFKLKRTGPIKYHLGMDFERDPDGTLYYAPRKYID